MKLNRNFKLFTTKSIYKKAVKPVEKASVYNILEYGYPESKFLREPSKEIISLPSIQKLKTQFESLRMTAAENNLYSLSFPQVKIQLNAFCMHRNLKHYQWKNTNPEVILNKENYETVINPRIVTASKINHFEYESCGSFNCIKAKAKRPLAVLVAYFDETGKPQEKKLYDFEARVFCHEYDHLQGTPFIHWKVSEGEIEIDSNDPYENLQFTIEYYKNRIRDTRNNNPDVFDFFDLHMVNIDYDNYIEERTMIDYELRSKKKVSYEHVMLIDVEKAIRKDLKLKLKRETQRVDN